MDRLISNIQRVEDDGCEIVAILERNSEFLAENISHLDNLLESCETGQWTYVYAAIIRAKLAAVKRVEPDLLMEIRTFFEAADAEQLLTAKSIVYDLSSILTEKLISQSLAARGIPILTIAIKRMLEASHYLTRLHVHICQLALFSKFFSPVLQFLNEDILDVDPDKEVYDTKDALLYFYYGGLIYAALKMWKQSYKFFSIVCSIPAPPYLKILVLAWKKLFIVSLICRGEFEMADFPILRKWKFNFPNYRDLEAAYMSSQPTALVDYISNHESYFAKEQNLGLVKQLVDAQIKRRILNLTKTFISMSLQDLATRVHLSTPEAAERQLLELAAAKLIYVKIDARSGCVRFLDSPELYDSPQVLESLIQKMKLTMNYETTLRRIVSEETTSLPQTDVNEPSRQTKTTPAVKRKPT